MVRINLLPIRDILRKRELKNFAFVAAGIVAVAVAAMVVVYLGFSWKISALEDKRQAEKQKLEELQRKNKEINNLKLEIARLQKQVDTIEKLTKTRDSPAPFMAAVSAAIPDAVWISSMSKQGRNFAIQGTGIDNKTVVDFVEQLRRVRLDFEEKNPWIDPSNKEHKTFFRNVKLVQIVRKGGLGAMGFKIVGRLR